MKLHMQGSGGAPLSATYTERLLMSLLFTERSLREAADLTFEDDVRRRVLRAADRLESAIDTVRASIVNDEGTVDITTGRLRSVDVAV